MSNTMLDEATECLLAQRWTTFADPEARGTLVASQQRLVAQIARKYRGYGCSESDLVQEGNLGLLRAVDRFDPTRGVRLSTYAAWWIKAYILRFIENNSQMIRGVTTADRQRLFYQLGKTKERLAAAGEDASPTAIADALEVSERDATEMELLHRGRAHLDGFVDPSRRPGIESIIDTGPTPEAVVQSAELEERLERALLGFESTLSGRALEMFRDRIASRRPVSLAELGDRWGVTRAAARRVQERVVRPLRRHLYREFGDTIVAALGTV